MNLSSLRPAIGSLKSRRRIGRGTGSGMGGTSTRGHKGAKSRSGYKSKLGFEGGQMPLQRRLPKFGFTNPNRVEYKSVNLDVLQQIVESTNTSLIDVNFLVNNGLASKRELIKILGRGELKSKVNVTAHGFSASAIAAIEKVGGTVTTL
jgi:large subunit ribosomal protein L15